MSDTQLGLCSCMGPVENDPMCPCAMRRAGLEPTNPWTPEKLAELQAVLDTFSNTED